MKNLTKLFGTALITAVLVFGALSLTGCSDGSEADLIAAAPTANPPAGKVDIGTKVTLSTATPEAIIYYTIDNTTPTASSHRYETPISIEGNTTIKAIAVRTGWIDSDVLTAVYTVDQSITATPTADPPAGEVEIGTQITLSTTTPGAIIYFTIDNNDPTESSEKYETPITIEEDTVIKAIAVRTGWINSAVLTAEYTVDQSIVAAPTADPPAGTYYEAQSVTLKTFTKEARIYYTIDNSEPSAESSTLFDPDTPISITNTTTIKAIAVKDDITDSGILTAIYTISSGNNAEEAIHLTEDNWAGGNITTSNRTKWYKFTATASTQYIHFSPGTLSSISAQLYDLTNTEVGSEFSLSGSTANITRTATIGQEYYIRVWSNSSTGTYRIGFCKFSLLIPEADITQLTENIWAEGSIWYKFTATANTQYIHFSPGTLSSVSAQVYNSNRTTEGIQSTLSGSAASISRTLTSGREYYIRVWNSSNAGTYRIGFSKLPIIIPETGITQLTENIWAEGNITADMPIREQWYKFIATASTQYIHFSPGTLGSVSAQVYNSSRTTVGIQSTLSGSAASISRTLTSGQEYYIRIWNNSSTGTYRIGFGKLSIIIPETGIIQLTEDTWADGDITTANREQWYKFTATAITQYIHFSPSTLSSVSAQVYNSTYTAVGSESTLSGVSITQTVTIGQEYYIKVWSNSSTGTYQIAFNDSFISPSGFVELTEDTWADGNLTTENRNQWYKFTATAETQWIHFSPGTLSSVSVQVYNSNVATVGDSSTLSGSAASITRAVMIGHEYYIRVWSNSNTGTYRIGFSKLSILIPEASVTQLTEDDWAESNITADIREQWYKFTATAETQWIHFSPGTLSSVSVQVYNSSRTAIETQSTLSGSTTRVSRTVTNGQVYYIRVWNSTNTGTYRIGFNDLFISPSGFTELTQDTWADGNITTDMPIREHWYKFTATAETQWIHFSPGTLGSASVQVYNSNGTTLENSSTLSNSTATRVSRTVANSQEYYIRVWNNSNTGTYRIGFNKFLIPPETGTLIEDNWTDGNITADTTNREQWYKFTATADTQYIHFSSNTLGINTVSVQLYDSNGTTVGNSSTLSSSEARVYRTITINQVYYIRIWNSTNTGTYRIGFNHLFIPPETGITQLTEDNWADGNITADTTNREQWYKFTATAETQWIHYSQVDLTFVYMQVYDSNGTTVESYSNLSGRVSQTLTRGQVYYIRVWNSHATGTYRIGFNHFLIPPETGIILIEDNWTDGNITADTTNREQWYKFTATAETQWVHFSPGTLSSVSVQVYDSNGTTVESASTYLSGRVSRTLTSGQEYYIRVWNSSANGTYRIGFNKLLVLPEASVIQLTEDTWADGNITEHIPEQWYKFTATAGTQWIHYSQVDLTFVNMQLHDSYGTTVGSRSTLSNSNLMVSLTLTSGQEYYIRVWPSGSGTGTYQIGFNKFSILRPETNITPLTEDTWADGNITTANMVQWYKFTATVGTQYIHFSPDTGTLSNVNVQLYNSNGTIVEDSSTLSNSTTRVSRVVTTGQEYYIRVWSNLVYNIGTYRIGFNDSFISPSGFTELAEDDWAEGNITPYREQLYKFTATASTQWIHFSTGTMSSVFVQVYDSNLIITVGSSSILSSSTARVSRSVTIGQEYYIRVWNNSDAVTYQIGFNTTDSPPPTQ